MSDRVDYSDGDASQRPGGGSGLAETSDQFWRAKLAKMEEAAGGRAHGPRQELDRLPAGYCLFERARGGQTRTDKYLYGHPSGRAFRSAVEFFPHLQHLVRVGGGQQSTCSCHLCPGAPGASANPGLATLAPATGGPEGAPNLFAPFRERIAAGEEINELIGPDHNSEWLVTNGWLPHDILGFPTRQYAFEPREGELVLYHPPECDVWLDERARQNRCVSRRTGEFVTWRAGIVVQRPPPEIRIEAEHVQPPMQRWLPPRWYVQCYLGPTSTVSTLSAENGWVPMHWIRPFNYYAHVLQRIPRNEWHESIPYALTMMATVAVTHPSRFRGVWPLVEVGCHGAYVGSELLVAGDPLRIRGRFGAGADEEVLLMALDNITCRITYADPECTRPLIDLSFTGATFAARPTAIASEPLRPSEMGPLPRGMFYYYPWYRRDPPGRPLTVALSQVLGRCYESGAVGQWLSRDPDITTGLSDIEDARQISRTRDRRRPAGQEWFFAEDRLHQLQIDRDRFPQQE